MPQSRWFLPAPLRLGAALCAPCCAGAGMANESAWPNFHILVLHFLLSVLGSKISESCLESALTTDGLQFVFMLS